LMGLMASPETVSGLSTARMMRVWGRGRRDPGSWSTGSGVVVDGIRGPVDRSRGSRAGNCPVDGGPLRCYRGGPV